MLQELQIENIAVIEKADIGFGPGLNVLTGETGAGKSIIIDAVAAVTGARVSRDLIRGGAENAVWSYEAPYAAVAEIGDHLAFYPDRVEVIEINR